MRIGKFAAGLWAVSLSVACGDDASGSGTLTVSLSAEASISEGLTLGDDEENSRDYAVTFSKYLVAIGRVKLGRSGQPERSDDRVFVADMLRVGEQGVPLLELGDLASGRWEQLSYETPVTPASATAVTGVTPADLQVMVDKQLTYWIEGSVAGPRKVDFSFQVAAPARFAMCQTDARPGVAVPEDARTGVSLTLHGDHLFFNQFLTGDEGTIARQAKWIVDADVDGDGKLVTADLASQSTERLFPSNPAPPALGYTLSGGPYGPVGNALDFVRAQLATQGHVNGEGECVWEPL